MKTIYTCGLAAVLAVGCGGQGAKLSGKQGAADGLFAAASATNGTSDKTSQPLSINADGTASIACEHGGSAKLSGFQLVTTGLGVGVNLGQQFTITYSGCGVSNASTGGVAYLDGSLVVKQSIVTTQGSASIDQTFKGKVTFSGAIDDFIDADVVQKVEAGKLSATSGGVSVVLKGNLSTNDGSHTFDEEVNVTAGSISASLPKK